MRGSNCQWHGAHVKAWLLPGRWSWWQEITPSKSKKSFIFNQTIILLSLSGKSVRVQSLADAENACVNGQCIRHLIKSNQINLNFTLLRWQLFCRMLNIYTDRRHIPTSTPQNHHETHSWNHTAINEDLRASLLTAFYIKWNGNVSEGGRVAQTEEM